MHNSMREMDIPDYSDPSLYGRQKDNTTTKYTNVIKSLI